MRFSTDFLEYLRYSVATDLKYHHTKGDDQGEFEVNSKRTSYQGNSVKKMDVNECIKVSKELRRTQKAKKLFKRLATMPNVPQ